MSGKVLRECNQCFDLRKYKGTLINFQDHVARCGCNCHKQTGAEVIPIGVPSGE